MKNDLSTQFDSLNKEIVSSINKKNYARATLLDQARQEHSKYVEKVSRKS